MEDGSVWEGAETAQHAGHADIVRELIDGKAGAVDAAVDGDYLARVQAAADSFAGLQSASTSITPFSIIRASYWVTGQTG